MRKYLYYLGILIALLLTLNSCEKEMMDYEGEDALYFDVLSSYRNTKLCIISIRTKRFSNLFSKIVRTKTRIPANEPVTRKKIHPQNPMYKL